MPLTYGLQTAKELLEKLRRDAALLDEEVSSDRFFNFVVTGYSLIDWIKNDPAVPAAAKAAVSPLYSDPWLKVCGDLATASKHFILTTRVPMTADASSNRGWGAGRFGKGGWGVGEESIAVKLNDGTTYSGLDLVKEVLQMWDRFFSTHGI
jgi:hypothetical protein